MAEILQGASVKGTTLWKKLNEGPWEDQALAASQVLSENVASVCYDASKWMGRVPAIHSEFTLHDQTHSLRVTELMARILGDALQRLNPVELALLILAAHCHDLGMVIGDEEVSRLDNIPEFTLHRDNWITEHPNWRELEQQESDPLLSQRERSCASAKLADLRFAVISDWVRAEHGSSSARIIRNEYGHDRRLEVMGTNLSEALALLCLSHVQAAGSLVPSNGYKHDCLIGTFPVNLIYLAVVLRLADILDFDRDRTPDVLFRSIHFSNDISLREWEKHRGVQGWAIGPELIRFEMLFDHPVYERTARSFMDWIDTELVCAHELVRLSPAAIGGRYTLQLPQRVDRSRIGPRGKAYIYYDLEFSLSRDEIVKLLMTDKLYQSPSICIRELLQNSLDALRYRKALLATAGHVWSFGEVELEHTLDDDGYEVIRCRDNGIGMDEFVITQFLNKAGRSYYRSPYFAQERVRLKATGQDFDPCAQFGIGFMSCFMLGDRIRIDTRRDYGPDKGWGTPWMVEINGLGGMIVLRPGKADQAVGTTVTIRSRKKPLFLDKWEDQVKLIAVLDGWALATEFPIRGRCNIENLEEEIVVPPTPAIRQTELEEAKVDNILTLESEFSRIDPLLAGVVRESFLLDSEGKLTMSNASATWRCPEKPTDRAFLTFTNGHQKKRYHWNNGATCVDGILVCGEPGRRMRDMRLGSRGNSIQISSPFILDVRGAIKPRLTPARTPPEHTGMLRDEPTWSLLQQKASLAEGRLWAELLSRAVAEGQLQTWWELTYAYEANVLGMEAEAIYKHLGFAKLYDAAPAEWLALSALGRLMITRTGELLSLTAEDGTKVGLPPDVIKWCPSGNRDHMWPLIALSISCSSLSTRGDSVWLTYHPPTHPIASPLGCLLRTYMGSTLTAPFQGDVAEAVCVGGPLDIVNSLHPLAHNALVCQNRIHEDELRQVSSSICRCLADADTHSAIVKGEVSHWMKYMARRTISLDWSKYDVAMQPPYSIWLPEKGLIEVTEDDLRRWAESDLRRG